MSKFKCTSCDKEYEEFQKFCNQCGSAVEEVTETAAETASVISETPAPVNPANDVKETAASEQASSVIKPDLSVLDSLKGESNGASPEKNGEIHDANYYLKQNAVPKEKKSVNPIDIIALIVGLIGAALLTQGVKMHIFGAICGLIGAALAVVSFVLKNKKEGKASKIQPLSAIAITVGIIVLAVGAIMTAKTVSTYNKGIAYMNSGEYYDASECFGTITDYKDSEELFDKCLIMGIYDEAEEALAEGKNYAAYEMFLTIDDYADSAQRAKACVVPFPATGVLYRNPAYASDTAIIRMVSGSYMKNPMYVKVYNASNNELAATMFVGVGAQCDVYLPLGTYEVRFADGANWFGEEDMFGDDADYSKIDDKTVLDTAGGGIIWTIGISGGSTSDTDVPKYDF